LQLLYETGSAKGVQPVHVAKLKRILAALDVALCPQELDLPSFHLHPLSGDLFNYWSIRVNGNWRVIFRFTGIDVELVDYLDYH